MKAKYFKMKKAIAVIDQSVNGLFIYDVNEDFIDEQIEGFLHENGHHLSNCSWGVFDGEIEDQRDSEKGDECTTMKIDVKNVHRRLDTAMLSFLSMRTNNLEK